MTMFWLLWLPVFAFVVSALVYVEYKVIQVSRKRMHDRKIRQRHVDYNRIGTLEQELFGHLWPNPDSPWNQAAIDQMAAMRREMIEDSVRRRQRAAARNQQSAVIQTLYAILGRQNRER